MTRWMIWLAIVVASLVATFVHAGETVTYRYDALGRLVSANVSGGPAGGVGTTYAHDAAGNRTRVATGGVPSPQPSPTPTPTPTPTPSPTPTTPASSVPVVANAGFAQPDVGGGGFAYGPSVSGNRFGGGAGVAADGSAWGFPAAPDGNGQAAFLQSARNGAGDSTAVAMAVSGLTLGATYVVRFQMTLRPGHQANQLRVTIGDAALGLHVPATAAWQQVQTTAFTASQASATLTFTGLTSGDTASGIDAVQVVASGGAGTANPTPGTVASASFESPAVGSHEYGPSVPGATFAGGSGIAANGGAFGFPATADGNQMGFLQTAAGGGGTITLSVTGLTVGASYRIVVKLVSRPGFAQSQLRASVGGTTLLDAAAPSGWTSVTSSAFTANAASVSLVFQGVPQGANETATAIDAVQVLPR